MNCKRGEIVVVLFPDSNLRTAKLRPALVVQRDQLDTGHGEAGPTRNPLAAARGLRRTLIAQAGRGDLRCR